ncbi:MAG: hypothetical protein LDL53_02520 [Candidatus Hydrogenedens sp.]|nr:hypothetical protein [Candidatus Hydrogenedens sp.]
MKKRRTRKSVRKHEKDYKYDEEHDGTFVVPKISEAFIPKQYEKEGWEYRISSTPQGDLLIQLKKDRSRFFKMILFALILHLSAVTLFKIVVYIPRTDLQYLDIRVIQTDMSDGSISDRVERLKLSNNLETFENEDASDIEALKQTNKFELPQLEFEQLEKLRLRSMLTEEDTSLEPLIAEYKDSWAQFGEGINRIRESISALSPFVGQEPKDKESFRDTASPLMKQSLSNNLEIIYRWITPPFNRALLFVPGLLETSKENLSEKEGMYDFMLTVLPDGSVSQVLDLNITEDEISKYIRVEVNKIRFEPLIQVDSQEQKVTIRYRFTKVLP